MDVLFSGCALLVSAPLIGICCLLVFLSDRRNPFYVSARVGRGGRTFQLLKIRTMVIGAANLGADTTVAADPRLLAVGRGIRALKLDELPQFANVLVGDMSVVGPRPNVPREVRRYTALERQLLDVRPGITDFASIVFSDLADAIPAGIDANLGYNQFVRPWKARLGLHYVECASAGVDLRLVWLTALNFCRRDAALDGLHRILARTHAPLEVCEIARRRAPLPAAAPPGADRIVSAADLEATRE